MAPKPRLEASVKSCMSEASVMKLSGMIDLGDSMFVKTQSTIECQLGPQCSDLYGGVIDERK